MTTEKETINSIENNINNLYYLIKESTEQLQLEEDRLAKIKSRPMSSEEYQNAGYYTCPICRSEDVFQVDLVHTCGGDIALLEKECSTCGAKWEERYDFADIVILDAEDIVIRGSQQNDTKLCRCGEHIPSRAVQCPKCGEEGRAIDETALIGSGGMLIVNTEGNIVDCIQMEYSDIIKVDWDEYKKFYGETTIPRETDILELRVQLESGEWLDADDTMRKEYLKKQQ